MALVKCPECGENMVEMPSGDGISIVCSICGFLLSSNCRKNPHTHITQEELSAANRKTVAGSYNYQKETLLIV